MNIEHSISEAQKLHQSGNYTGAIELYEKVNSQYPNNSDVIHYLGLAKYQSGDIKSGTHLMEKAITLVPDNVVYRTNYGNALLESNNYLLAQIHLLEAVKLQKGNFNIHNDLGVTYKELGQYDLAIKHYKIALNLKPDFVLAYNNLGYLLVTLNKHENAIQCYKKAIENIPSEPLLYINLAKVYNIIHEFESAKTFLEKALLINDKLYKAHSNIAYALINLQQYAAAEKHLKRSLDLEPALCEPYVEYADYLSMVYRYDEAITYYKEALKIEKNSVIAHVNYANTLQEIGKYDEAIVHYKHALLIEPNNASAHHGLGYEYLRKGLYARGWQEHEWRFKVKNLFERTGHFKRYKTKEWDGKKHEKSKIYVYSEQGAGDVIQFARFITELEKLKFDIILGCDKQLHTLLSNFKGVKKTIELNEKPGNFDYQCSLLSLPFKLNTTLEKLPGKIPYIQVEHEYILKWKNRINNNDNYKVGIVWSGNPSFHRNRIRSPGLKAFEEIFELEQIDFYSLQLGSAKNELNASKYNSRIIDFSDEIKDFRDTAALMSNLDLIISSCTGPLHLAGALGLPVWAVLSKCSDWRWMLDRNDSPWYPTMKLFRAETMFDWSTVMNQIKAELVRLKDRSVAC